MGLFSIAKRVVGTIVSAIILIGVIGGILRYDQDSRGGVVAFLAGAIDTIADVTYRWVPTVIHYLGG